MKEYTVKSSVMDLDFFLEILGVPSTSGGERRIAEFLKERLLVPGCGVTGHEVGDGTLNLLFDWSGTGRPSFVFCTHLDTVPPYIKPSVTVEKSGDTKVSGRGSCDAKGQIFAMYNACLELQRQGFTDFGLLLLAGEETGSYGAKAWTRDCEGGEFVLVGEPTDNCLVTASKGTKAFEITIPGRPCHSGYPDHGVSAVDRFVDLMNTLKLVEFPMDHLLGPTTWNVGDLHSNNPQNILSPEISFRIYFRTTFATDELIQNKLLGACPRGSVVEALGGDNPQEYFCDVEGIGAKPVSFGSDAPRLTKFKRKAICGPGSILTAHTSKEHILVSEIKKAVEQDILIYKNFLLNK